MELHPLRAHEQNRAFKEQGQRLLFSVPSQSRILIVGQAPGGSAAMEKGVYWDDRSGDRLRDFMGVDRELFYESGKLAIVPMDFYFLVRASRATSRRAGALPRSGTSASLRSVPTSASPFSSAPTRRSTTSAVAQKQTSPRPPKHTESTWRSTGISCRATALASLCRPSARR